MHQKYMCLPWITALSLFFVCIYFFFSICFSNTYSPIVFMVALDNSAIVVRFAALDNLSHVAVDLEHPLFS